MPDVSVIIPTYHDWSRLRLCLEALAEQSLPRDRFEVIAVNNDPADQPDFPLPLPEGFTVIEEGKPGSYAARNAALKIAKGKFIAFTDADCIPDRDWLSNGIRYLQDPGIDRVAGHVELFYERDKLTWSDIYEKAFSFRQDEHAAGGLAVTANLLTTREVLDEVGHFDDRLLSRGDTVWNRKASQMGKSIVYGPDCIVRHPARSTPKELFKKRKRVAGGSQKGQNIKFTTMIRLMLPPLRLVPRLKKRADLSGFEKAIAFGYRYVLQVYGMFCRVKIKFGLEKESRG